MKKILLTLISGMFITTLALAGNADVFSYDADQLNQEMAQLQSLEDFVAVNPGVTLSTLEAENNALVSDMNLTSGNFAGGFDVTGPVLGISSFLWGCVLSWVGVLIVYLVADDSAETKKAFIGCIVGTLVYVVLDIVYYVTWL